jgi:hypothetical protein
LFSKVSTVLDYWVWLETYFLPTLYAAKYHNGTHLYKWWDRRCLNDFESRRMGIARMRQFRIKEGNRTCFVIMLVINLDTFCCCQYIINMIAYYVVTWLLLQIRMFIEGNNFIQYTGSPYDFTGARLCLIYRTERHLMFSSTSKAGKLPYDLYCVCSTKTWQRIMTSLLTLTITLVHNHPLLIRNGTNAHQLSNMGFVKNTEYKLQHVHFRYGALETEPLLEILCIDYSLTRTKVQLRGAIA